jgi:hypothetical protein
MQQAVCQPECRVIDFDEINTSNYLHIMYEDQINDPLYYESYIRPPYTYRGFTWSASTNFATIAWCGYGTVNPPRQAGRKDLNSTWLVPAAKPSRGSAPLLINITFCVRIIFNGHPLGATGPPAPVTFDSGCPFRIHDIKMGAA